MFTLPIFTYLVCYHFVFHHKAEPSNWAGGAAVLATNVIVFGYVFVAFSEPEDPKEKRYGDDENDNDASHPRVGIFKKRTN